MFNKLARNIFASLSLIALTCGVLFGSPLRLARLLLRLQRLARLLLLLKVLLCLLQNHLSFLLLDFQANKLSLRHVLRSLNPYTLEKLDERLWKVVGVRRIELDEVNDLGSLVLLDEADLIRVAYLKLLLYELDQPN